MNVWKRKRWSEKGESLRLALSSVSQLSQTPFKQERESLLAKIQALIPAQHQQDTEQMLQMIRLDIPTRTPATPFLEQLLEGALFPLDSSLQQPLGSFWQPTLDLITKGDVHVLPNYSYPCSGCPALCHTWQASQTLAGACLTHLWTLYDDAR